MTLSNRKVIVRVFDMIIDSMIVDTNENISRFLIDFCKSIEFSKMKWIIYNLQG